VRAATDAALMPHALASSANCCFHAWEARRCGAALRSPNPRLWPREQDRPVAPLPLCFTSRDSALKAKEFFDRTEHPAVLNCKSGADRASFVAALFLIVYKGKSIDGTQRQLSARYGHFRFSRTGILDAFFDLYRREGAAEGIPLLTWVERHHNAEAMEREFRPGFWSNLLVDRIMRPEQQPLHPQRTGGGAGGRRRPLSRSARHAIPSRRCGRLP
jgi:hypothetical protein